MEIEKETTKLDNTSELTVEKTWHPHAKGKLFKVLRRTTGDAYDINIGPGYYPTSEHPRYDEAMSVIFNALRKQGGKVAI